MANASHCFTKLERGNSLGLAFVASAGAVSATAVSGLLLLFARNIYRNFRVSRDEGQEFRAIRTHVDAYFLSLLMSDLFQGVGAALNLRWVKLGLVRCGRFCDVQGSLKQVGETGVPLATLVIALHTFAVIFFRWTPPKSNTFPAIVVGCIWLFPILFAVLGYTLNTSFYTPIPFWCWIGDNFTTIRIVAEYLWLWVAAFFSVLLYPVLFFSIRGNIVVDPERWTSISFHLQRRVPKESYNHISASFVHLPLPDLSGPSPSPQNVLSGPTGLRSANFPEPSGPHGAGHQQTPRPSATQSIQSAETKLAYAMLGYPICYIALVLPLSVIRWTTFVDDAQSNFGATAATLSLFGLSGAVNVVLFMYTRPNLLLFGRRRIDEGNGERQRRSTAGNVGVGLSSRDGAVTGPAFAFESSTGGFVHGKSSAPGLPFTNTASLNKIRTQDSTGYISTSEDEDPTPQDRSSRFSKVGTYSGESHSPVSESAEPTPSEEGDGIKSTGKIIPMPSDDGDGIKSTGKIIPSPISAPTTSPLPVDLVRGSSASRLSTDIGLALDGGTFGMMSQNTTVIENLEANERKSVDVSVGLSAHSKDGSASVKRTEDIDKVDPERRKTRNSDWPGEDHG